jgi:hypothetical protein
LLCDEAGIGKSRLVAEMKTFALARGFQCLQGHCFPADLSCPYAPLLDLFRSAFFTSDGKREESVLKRRASQMLCKKACQRNFREEPEP